MEFEVTHTDSVKAYGSNLQISFCIRFLEFYFDQRSRSAGSLNIDEEVVNASVENVTGDSQSVGQRVAYEVILKAFGVENLGRICVHSDVNFVVTCGNSKSQRSYGSFDFLVNRKLTLQSEVESVYSLEAVIAGRILNLGSFGRYEDVAAYSSREVVSDFDFDKSASVVGLVDNEIFLAASKFSSDVLENGVFTGSFKLELESNGKFGKNVCDLSNFEVDAEFLEVRINHTCAYAFEQSAETFVSLIFEKSSQRKFETTDSTVFVDFCGTETACGLYNIADEVFADSVENVGFSLRAPFVADGSIFFFDYVFNLYTLKSELVGRSFEVNVCTGVSLIVVNAEFNFVVFVFVLNNKAESVGQRIGLVKSEFNSEVYRVAVLGAAVCSIYVKVSGNLNVVEKVACCQVIECIVQSFSKNCRFNFSPFIILTAGKTNSCNRKNHHYNQQGNNDFFVLHNCNNLLVIHIFC